MDSAQHKRRKLCSNANEENKKVTITLAQQKPDTAQISTWPELQLDLNCQPSNPDTPQFIQLSFPIITVGRLHPSPTHYSIDSCTKPGVISRVQATIKHICGRTFFSSLTSNNPNLVPSPNVSSATFSNVTCTPRCPFHYGTSVMCNTEKTSSVSTPVISSPSKRSLSVPVTQCSTPCSKFSSSTSVLTLPQSVVEQSPSRLPFAFCSHSKAPDIGCVTSICGGGWVLVDGTIDGVKQSLYSVAINLELLRPVNKNQSVSSAIPIRTSPVGVWLRNHDRIRFGPDLNIPEFEYEFLASSFSRCPLEGFPFLSESEQESVITLTSDLTNNNICYKRYEQLRCSICTDWLLKTSTLACGHHFCAECIGKWLKVPRLRCPKCRQDVTQLPILSYDVDGTVEALIPQNEKQEYQRRLEEFEQNVVKDRKHCELIAAKVGERENEFLHVKTNWSCKERDKITRQLNILSGLSRQCYCRLFGLTEEWLLNCKKSELIQAATNLGLPWDKTHPYMLRQRLILFLHYA